MAIFLIQVNIHNNNHFKKQLISFAGKIVSMTGLLSGFITIPGLPTRFDGQRKATGGQQRRIYFPMMRRAYPG
jgi:hypothetical protein